MGNFGFGPCVFEKAVKEGGMEERRGGCLCGAVTYRVTGAMRPVVACHCTQCRKTSGHHVAATSAPRGGGRDRGCGDLVSLVRDGAAGVLWQVRFEPVLGWSGANLSIFAGTLDGATGLELAGHIYCDDKGDYYRIADGTRQVGGAESELTTVVSDQE